MAFRLQIGVADAVVVVPPDVVLEAVVEVNVVVLATEVVDGDPVDVIELDNSDDEIEPLDEAELTGEGVLVDEAELVDGVPVNEDEAVPVYEVDEDEPVPTEEDVSVDETELVDEDPDDDVDAEAVALALEEELDTAKLEALEVDNVDEALVGPLFEVEVGVVVKEPEVEDMAEALLEALDCVEAEIGPTDPFVLAVDVPVLVVVETADVDEVVDSLLTAEVDTVPALEVFDADEVKVLLEGVDVDVLVAVLVVDGSGECKR